MAVRVWTELAPPARPAEPFDTVALQPTFAQEPREVGDPPWNDTPNPERYEVIPREGLLYTPDGELFDTGDPDYAANRGFNWVMTDTGRIYAALPTAVDESGLAHHSNFVGGGDVAGAGSQLRVRAGILLYLDDQSGHYLPPRWMTRQVLARLARDGVVFEENRGRWLAPPEERPELVESRLAGAPWLAPRGQVPTPAVTAAVLADPRPDVLHVGVPAPAAEQHPAEVWAAQVRRWLAAQPADRRPARIVVHQREASEFASERRAGAALHGPTLAARVSGPVEVPFAEPDENGTQWLRTGAGRSWRPLVASVTHFPDGRSELTARPPVEWSSLPLRAVPGRPDTFDLDHGGASYQVRVLRSGLLIEPAGAPPDGYFAAVRDRAADAEVLTVHRTPAVPAAVATDLVRGLSRDLAGLVRFNRLRPFYSGVLAEFRGLDDLLRPVPGEEGVFALPALGERPAYLFRQTPSGWFAHPADVVPSERTIAAATGSRVSTGRLLVFPSGTPAAHIEEIRDHLSLSLLTRTSVQYVAPVGDADPSTEPGVTAFSVAGEGVGEPGPVSVAADAPDRSVRPDRPAPDAGLAVLAPDVLADLVGSTVELPHLSGAVDLAGLTAGEATDWDWVDLLAQEVAAAADLPRSDVDGPLRTELGRVAPLVFSDLPVPVTIAGRTVHITGLLEAERDGPDRRGGGGHWRQGSFSVRGPGAGRPREIVAPVLLRSSLDPDLSTADADPRPEPDAGPSMPPATEPGVTAFGITSSRRAGTPEPAPAPVPPAAAGEAAGEQAPPPAGPGGAAAPPPVGAAEIAAVVQRLAAGAGEEGVAPAVAAGHLVPQVLGHGIRQAMRRSSRSLRDLFRVVGVAAQVYGVEGVTVARAAGVRRLLQAAAGASPAYDWPGLVAAVGAVTAGRTGPLDVLLALELVEAVKRPGSQVKLVDLQQAWGRWQDWLARVLRQETVGPRAGVPDRG
jgi:hypothetical protein